MRSLPRPCTRQDVVDSALGGRQEWTRGCSLVGRASPPSQPACSSRSRWVRSSGRPGAGGDNRAPGGGHGARRLIRPAKRVVPRPTTMGRRLVGRLLRRDAPGGHRECVSRVELGDQVDDPATALSVGTCRPDVRLHREDAGAIRSRGGCGRRASARRCVARPAFFSLTLRPHGPLAPGRSHSVIVAGSFHRLAGRQPRREGRHELVVGVLPQAALQLAQDRGEVACEALHPAPGAVQEGRGCESRRSRRVGAAGRRRRPARTGRCGARGSARRGTRGRRCTGRHGACRGDRTRRCWRRSRRSARVRPRM